MFWDGWPVILYALAAMIMDLRWRRIPNWYLFVGWSIGALNQIFYPVRNGWSDYFLGCMIPILLLFLLFYFRMMGAGDIKLLSVLGGMVGVRSIFLCMFWSLILGAVISAGILFFRNAWSQRFRYFIHYIQMYIKTGVRVSYRSSSGGWEQIHFAVPVFLAVLLWKGGVV